MSVNLKQGETKTAEIKIKNTGDKKLSISIISENVGNLINIGEPFFEINKEEEKIIFIGVRSESENPGQYLKKLIISSATLEKEITLSIEIETPETLFDLILELEKNQFSPREEISAKTQIYNLSEKNEVEIKYEIKNSNDIILTSSTEKLKIKETEFVKKINLPSNTPPGDYILYAKISYEGKTASASQWLTITGKTKQTSNIKTKIIILIIILGLIIGLILFKKK